VRVFPEARDPFKAFFEDALGDALEAPGLGAMVRSLARIVRALGPAVEILEAIQSDQHGARLRASGVETIR